MPTGKNPESSHRLGSGQSFHTLPPYMLQLLENSCPERQQPAGNSSGLWNAELTLGFVWKSLAFVEQTPRRQSPWKSHYNREILF